MGEIYQPSEAEMGIAETSEEKKVKKPSRLKQAVRAGAFVAMGVVGGGAARSAAVEAADHGKQEVRMSTWHQMYESVRSHIHEAQKQGADAEKIDAYMKEAMRIINQNRSQGNAPDSALAALEHEWNTAFHSVEDDFDKATSAMDAQFDSATAKMDKDFADRTAEMDASFSAATTEMDKEFDAAVKEQEAEFQGAVAGIKHQNAAEGKVEHMPTLHVDTLDAGVKIDEAWMLANVGKAFIQGEKFIVVQDGYSQDMQRASDKAELAASGKMAEYANQLQENPGSTPVMLRGTQIALTKFFQEGGKYKAIVVMEMSIPENTSGK